MIGQEFQDNTNKITVEKEQLPDGTEILSFAPQDLKDLDAALLQAKNTGIDLIKKGQLNKFNAGFEAVLDGQRNLAVKVYLTGKSYLNSPPQVVNQDLSHLFYSNFPHIEKVLLEKYFNQGSGVFIETMVGDGLTGSPTKFFEEFRGWVGVLVEEQDFNKLTSNRTHPGSLNFNGRLTNKSNSDFQTKVTYTDLISLYNLQRVDLLYLRETGKQLLEVLSGISDSNIKPKVIVTNYLDDKITLHELKNYLDKLNYRLDKVYYQFAIFVRK